MKYNNAISKITIDENFKERLIANLETNDSKVENKKMGVIMKVKKIVITIISILAALLGSGVVYAAAGGTINGVPVLEWMGIKFSEENYEEYVEIVENQVILDDDFRIELESTVCDDGFTILQFRVNISEDKLNSYKTEEDIESDWEVPFCYLSFNDPIIEEDGYTYTNLGGANYNLIIDNEDVWVRGYSAQQMEEISESEYIVYQMWFLDETTLNGKEDFCITLNDIVIGLGEDAIAVDGNFEVEVSKEKALENTTSFTPEENNSFEYGKMTKTLEKVTCTPLQNILTIRTVYEDVDVDDLTYVLDEDYIGTVNYIAFNKDNENISAFTAGILAQLTYEDGTVEVGIPGEFEWARDNFEHATYEVVEKVAIEASSSITGINIRAYEIEDDGYDSDNMFGNVKAIGKITIDLETGITDVTERNEYIFDGIEHDPIDEFVVYAKVLFGMNYDELYDYIIELRNEEVNYSDNEYGFDLESIWIDIDEVEYIELRMIDVESDELEYTELLEVYDIDIISELIDRINDSSVYYDFEEIYETDELVDGAPIIHIVLADYDLWITASDGFDDGTGTYISAFKLEVGDSSEIYKCNSSGLAESIENYYLMLSE